MTAIKDFVQTTSYEMAPANLRLPGPLWTAFTILSKVHSTWRWYRRANLYTNPDNFAALLSGHAVNFLLGESVLLKMAAQSLLIATRLLHCTKQQTLLFHEYKSLILAIKGHYPMPSKISWDAGQAGRLLSPSTAYEWKSLKQNLYHRAIRVAKAVARVFKETFLLSMCIMDAIDAFYISPGTSNEAISLSFVNMITCLNELVEKKEALLKGMEENQKLIEKILVSSPFSYPQLFGAVRSALKTGEAVHGHAKKVASFGNGIIAKLGKGAMNGMLVLTGIDDYLPTAS